MSLQDFERETVYGFSNAGTKANVTTFNFALMNKLDKYCKDFPKDYQFVRDIIIDDRVEGKEYICKKNLISIRKPTTTKMSDDQKQEVAARMKKGKDKKKK